MSHRVRVNAGYKGVSLPNGKVYDGPTVVTLTDHEFESLRDALFPEVLTDLGDILPAGAELGFAERITNFTSTQVGAATLTTSIIPGLAVTVVGTGTPVGVEFYCLAMHATTANNAVGVGLVINGVLPTRTQLAQTSSAKTNVSVSLHLTDRFVIPEGEEWTFEIGCWGETGSKTYVGAEGAPMTLSVTQR